MLSQIKKLVLIVLSASVLACTSCKSTVPSLPPGPVTATVVEAPKPPQSEKITRDDWEFTLPSAGWVHAETPNQFSLVMVNKEKHNMLIMVNEIWAGSVQDYVLMAIKGIRTASASIIALKQISVDGKDFILLESAKENVRVFTLVTVVNGHGYGLSCGGPADEDNQHDLCMGIIKSFKVK